MILRIFAFLALLLSVLYLPFWVSIILAFLGMAYFSFFLEAVFLFFLSDLLFGAREPKFFNIMGISFLLALGCFILLELLKKKLRLRLE